MLLHNSTASDTSYDWEFTTNYTNATTATSDGYSLKYPTTTEVYLKEYAKLDKTSGAWYYSNDNDNYISSGVSYKTAWEMAATAWLESNKYYYKWESGKAHRVPTLSPQDRLREIIQSRQAPAIHVRRKPMLFTEDIREMRARETLRTILGEEGFRNYVRNGFITVRARSGKSYQIFPSHGMTAVYQGGKMIEKLCVVLSGNFPPTDSLIMRYLLILNDENDFRSHANVWGAYSSPQRQTQQSQEPLTDIFRRLKVA